MLINSSDFHKSINVSGSFDFDKLITSIKSIERSLLIPYLGQDLYDDLNTAYQAQPSASQQTLLDLIHPILAYLSVWKSADILNVDITAKGFQANHSSDKKPAFEWQVRNAKSNLRKLGYAALEELLIFLEENEDKYPAWESSQASDNNRDLIIKTAKEFSESIRIDRSMFQLLRPYQLRIQRNLIRSLLGKELYMDIMESIRLDAPTPEHAAILPDMKNIVAHSVYADALVDLPVIVDEEGIHFFSNAFSGNFSGKETADKSYLNTMISKHERISSRYADELTAFLNENILDYPLFVNSTSYENPDDDIDDDIDETALGIIHL